MPPVEDHGDYQNQRDTYVSQLGAAQAARDETAEAKAEASWAKAQLTMLTDLSSQQTAKATHTAAIADLKAKFPAVPEAAYAHLTDIKAMTKLVEEIAPNFVGAAPAPAPGFTPPAGDGKPRQTPKSPFDDPIQAQAIADRARKGDRQAQEDIGREVWKTQIAPKMDKLGPALEKGRAKFGVGR